MADIRQSPTIPERRLVGLHALPLGTLAWGALSFGAVYPWAYWPLAAACLVSGVAALVATRAVPIAVQGTALTLALGVLAVAILLQLIPLPLSAVVAISPRTVELLGELNPAFAAGLMKSHPVSVWPHDTWVALTLYGAMTVLLLGTVRLLSVTGPQQFVKSLTVLGGVLALIGIVQKPLYNGAIYGLWRLEVGRMRGGWSLVGRHDSRLA